MAVNFLTKPVLQMNCSDYARMLSEGAKRNNKLYEFCNDGKISEAGQKELIADLERLGYDCDSMMDVTIGEFLQRSLEKQFPVSGLKLDYKV